MKTILETDRLFLREMTKNDFDALCTILQDEDVMYAYEHAFNDIEVHEWLDRQIMRYTNDGFGLWLVVLKDTNEIIGQCGLTMQSVDEMDVVEVGYLFAKKFWHNGYALESAIACKNHAFNTLNIDEVFSIIRDTNTASRNVAKKNGMTYRFTITKHYYNIDMPHYVYSVKK